MTPTEKKLLTEAVCAAVTTAVLVLILLSIFGFYETLSSSSLPSAGHGMPPATQVHGQ